MSSALVDEVLSPEKLAQLFVQTMSPKHHEQILALLQKSDTAKLLASGQKTVLDFTSSPFPEPPTIDIPPEAVEAVDYVETDADADVLPNSQWYEPGDSDKEAEEVLGHATIPGAEEELQSSGQTGARKRAAPVRLDNSVPFKKKEKKLSNSATPISGSTRQPYNCTGLFSKDPLKAAAARASLAAAGKELPSRATEPKYAKGETDKAGEMNTISKPACVTKPARVELWCVVLSEFKEQLKVLKAKVKDQDIAIIQLKAQVASNKSVSALELSNMELKTKLESQGLIDAAWLKGFNRCKDNFKELKELQSM